MKPELVRFSSRSHPFRVEIICCGNPECECTDVTFDFREKVEDGQAPASAIAFQVRIDGLAWKEIAPPSRPPEIARLVRSSCTITRPANGRGSSGIPEKMAAARG